MSFNIPDVSKISGKGWGGGSSEPNFIPNPTPVERDYYRQGVFNTGSLWLGGQVIGGLYGAVEGVRAAPGSSTRIVMNSVLNGISHRGSALANRLAVVAILNIAWTAVGHFTLEDTIPDYLDITPPPLVVPVLAGMATGSSFLLGQGHKNPRVYVLGAALGGAVSCAHYFYGTAVYNTIFGKPGRR